MTVSKEDILAKVNTYDIFHHFLEGCYGVEPVKPGVHIHVPEISGEQKTPSFNIYFSRRSGEYRYKDFTGHDGSAFDLVMNLYNVSFVESLRIINKEMNLGLEDNAVKYELSKHRFKPEVKIEIERNYNYKLEYFSWTDKKKHATWWARFGTPIQTLELYGWKPVNLLKYYSKKGKLITIQDYNYKLIFAWERNGWGKYYMPEILGIQKKRFGYFGEKQEGYVFGIEQLPEYGDDLYLIGGEKDVTNSRSHGMFSVCLTSEESHPVNYPSFIDLIKSGRFKNCWILYDLDKTGKKQSEKISKIIPELKPKLLPIIEGDDISEFLLKKYQKYMF